MGTSIRGLVLAGPGDVCVREDLPSPVVEAPTDAVVAVRRAGLCGSDLHPFEGRERVRPGVVCGHEVVGDVVATGAAVRQVSVGDRVVVPFTTSCGGCRPCRSGLSSRCVRGQLFGYGDPDRPEVPALPGGQAERLRVPLADTTLVPAPPRLGDVEALLLADVVPPGWYAVARADVAAGAPLAVVGLGAVGLCAVAAARTLGAAPVLAVDPVADRRDRAALLGAVPVAPGDAPAALEDLAGDGFPAVVEAAGTPAAQALAFQLLRPGGTLSVIAVQTGDRFAFTPIEGYDRNATVRVGRAPVRSLLGDLLPRIAEGRLPLPSDLVVTHPAVPLSEGPDAYRRFAARETGLVKVAFVP